MIKKLFLMVIISMFFSISVEAIDSTSGIKPFEPTLTLSDCYRKDDEATFHISYKNAISFGSPTYTPIYVWISTGSLENSQVDISSTNHEKGRRIFEKCSDEGWWKINDACLAYNSRAGHEATFTVKNIPKDKVLKIKMYYEVSDGAALSEKSNIVEKELNPELFVYCNPISVKLGEKIDYKKIISKIEYKGEIVNIDDCSMVSFSEPQRSVYDTVDGYTFRINYHGVTKIVTAPIKINWGKCISLWNSSNQSIGAFTLVNHSIIGVIGKDKSGEKIDKWHELPHYYSVDIFSAKNWTSDSKVMSDSSCGDYHLEAKGSQNKLGPVYFGWKDVFVNEGDVVKVYHTFPTQNNFFDGSEKKQNSTNGKNNVYYQIKNDNYEPMHFNQLKVIDKLRIPVGASTEYLDMHIKDFIDNSQFPNVKILKFIAYPNTSEMGIKKGVIRVVEKTVTGKNVFYDYDVSFDVSSFLKQSTSIDKKEVIEGEEVSLKIDY
ncbi:hypothetical protein, partial [Enterococcus faecium]|uniref:hypothetical protein n=1 Tax=Enterococcus faecium TaxID=1352 RepID=UPI0025B20194